MAAALTGNPKWPSAGGLRPSHVCPNPVGSGRLIRKVAPGEPFAYEKGPASTYARGGCPTLIGAGEKLVRYARATEIFIS